jgi:hypothetical protein
LNTPEPKSKVTVKKPLLTAVALFVIGPARAAPPMFVMNNVKVKS